MNEMNIDLLIRSFDEELSDVERKTLESALQNSAELRQYKKELMTMRNLLSAEKNSFSVHFTNNVMAEVSRDDFYSNFSGLFNWFALPGAAAVAVLLGMNYYFSGNLSFDGILGLQSLSDEIVTFTVIGF